MRSVWKYPLTGWGPAAKVRHEVAMPSGATVLSLQNQHGVSTLRAEVDPQSPQETRNFEWAGTGHPVPDGGKYVGTVQIHDGEFVFHLYEVTP